MGKPKYRIDVYADGAIIRLKDRRVMIRKNGDDWELRFDRVLSAEEATLDLPTAIVRKGRLQHTAIILTDEALMGIFTAINELTN